MGRSDEIILWLSLLAKPSIPVIYVHDRKQYASPWRDYYQSLAWIISDNTGVTVKPTISEKYPPSISSIPGNIAFLSFSEHDWLPDSYMAYTYSLDSIRRGVHRQTIIAEYYPMITSLARNNVNPSTFLETLSILPAILSLSGIDLHKKLWFVEDTIRFKLEGIYGPGERARFYLAYITRLSLAGRLRRLEDALATARVLHKTLNYTRITSEYNGFKTEIVLIGDMLDKHFLSIQDSIKSRRP